MRGDGVREGGEVGVGFGLFEDVRDRGIETNGGVFGSLSLARFVPDIHGICGVRDAICLEFLACSDPGD